MLLGWSPDGVTDRLIDGSKLGPLVLRAGGWDCFRFEKALVALTFDMMPPSTKVANSVALFLCALPSRMSLAVLSSIAWIRLLRTFLMRLTSDFYPVPSASTVLLSVKICASYFFCGPCKFSWKSRNIVDICSTSSLDSFIFISI